MINTIRKAISNTYHWFQLLKKGILSESFSGISLLLNVQYSISNNQTYRSTIRFLVNSCNLPACRRQRLWPPETVRQIRLNSCNSHRFLIKPDASNPRARPIINPICTRLIKYPRIRPITIAKTKAITLLVSCCDDIKTLFVCSTR